ncbi:hypothetical protein AVEN_257899-1 [Araneus ventricosus]|uniref:Uncharacterized protein n=1 Tax=Araneus ventricosus TaxID=182803 RepID=A0A4Y2Q8Z3_ARAVE|nr:hypothetical protein AVEN_257899-1 [Araneus ventricosus]
MSEVTVSLNYGIYLGFQFCVQIYSCSDEFEEVPCSIYTVRANFDSKPEFSEDSIKTYKRRSCNILPLISLEPPHNAHFHSERVRSIIKMAQMRVTQRRQIEGGGHKRPDTWVSKAHAQNVARPPTPDKPSAHTCTHDALSSMSEESSVYWLEL